MSFSSSVTHRDESLAIVEHAYRRLCHAELVLFLTARNLNTQGSDEDLASRLAHHDFMTYPYLRPQSMSKAISGQKSAYTGPKLQHTGPDLPAEILADIMDCVGDWELARAVGVPTSLTRPSVWDTPSPTDYAMLTGYLPFIRAADPIKHPPVLGVDLAIRFGYVHVLEYLLLESANQPDGSPFKLSFKHDLIPVKASLHGRLEVLSWWKHEMDTHPDLISTPSSSLVTQAINNAAYQGKVNVLDWWLDSGMQLTLDAETLHGATRHNRPEVLEWLDKSRLPLQYRLCDVEEALEDAIGGGEAARQWWRKKGVNFDSSINQKDWSKLQNLN
ncbi:hypothetical protein MKEN_00677400 [Mycena kentingensis (nom. inval.)]|nr:hypothetical protein MKEN_00677400 [Mycena kentingensis (nom. inval.)]